MRKLAWALLSGLACTGGLASTAAAVDVTIGLGAGAAPDYEGSNDYKGVPLWNLTLSNLYDPATFVSLRGTSLRSNFLAHPHFRLGLSAQFVPEREDVEDERVDEMRNIDSSFLIGGILGYDFNAAPQIETTVELDLRQDVANGNGFVADLRGRYGAPLNEKMRLGIELSSTWASDDYMTEYFGVSGNNAARSGLDQYNADGGLKDVGLSLSLTYNINANWNVSGSAAYKILLGDAEDSPIVDDRGDANQLFVGALVNYKF